MCIDRLVRVVCRVNGINPEVSSQSRQNRARCADLAELAGSAKRSTA